MTRPEDQKIVEVERYQALIGLIVNARTLTRTSNAIRVEVTSIADESPDGIEVYGYRQYPNRAQRSRRTMIPRRYFVPMAWLPHIRQQSSGNLDTKKGNPPAPG